MADSDGVSLKEYIDRRLEDMERATNVAFQANEKYANKIDENAEKWRASANEWRSAMVDRERNFLTRKEFYTMVGTVVGVIGVGLVVLGYLK